MINTYISAMLTCSLAELLNAVVKAFVHLSLAFFPLGSILIVVVALETGPELSKAGAIALAEFSAHADADTVVDLNQQDAQDEYLQHMYCV